jgi:hypothetical protein
MNERHDRLADRRLDPPPVSISATDIQGVSLPIPCGSA